MQIEAKKLDTANAELKAKISKDKIEQTQDKIAKKVAKTAKIDGFRKGSVPVHMVKKLHGASIKQEAEQEVLKAVLDDGLKKIDIEFAQVIGEPNITKFDRNDDGSLHVEVEISCKPELKLGDYHSMLPEYKAPRILKKDIEERANKLLSSSVMPTDIKEDRPVQKGDTVLIDFEGFLDGKAFDNGKADMYPLEIGSNSFIPGFEDALIGTNKGEEKEINVTFPKEYGSKDLAGKDVVFKIKLHNIQEKIVNENPSEEELKKLIPNQENPTLEMLHEEIKTQLKEEKLAKLVEEELKPKYIEKLIKNIDFDLPKAIVEQEMDMQTRNIFASLSQEEIKEYQDDPKKIEKKREEFRDEAIKAVKLTFIINELALAQKIEVKDQEIMQMIYFEALQQGRDPQAHLEAYKKQGLLNAVKMSVVENRLFMQLFAGKKGNKKQTDKEK